MKMFEGQMEIKGEYTLDNGITSGGRECIRVYDKNENVLYCESDSGIWYKKEYNRDNKITYEEDSMRGIIYDVRPRAEEPIKVDNDDTDKLIECNFCHSDMGNTDGIFIGSDVNSNDIICEDCVKVAMEELMEKKIEIMANRERERVSKLFEVIVSGRLI